MSQGRRDKVMVAYGGKSVEHEISVISALQAMQSIDPTKYEVAPLYISPLGTWHTGAALLEKSFYKKWQDNLSLVDQVVFLSTATMPGLYRIHKGHIDLDKPIEVDVVLTTFHGQYGEDGCIQGVFECSGTAYTSAPIAAAAIAMNKQLCKDLVSTQGIATLPSALINREETRSLGLLHVCEKASLHITQQGFAPWPLFIKPNNLGSSIGVGKASNMKELCSALAYAMRYDSQVLIEPCLDNLLEINVSVLDDDPVRVSVVEIPVASEKILSYEDKYLRGSKNKTGTASGSSSQGMAGLTRKIDPEDLDPAIKKQVQQWAKKAFIRIGCAGVVRIDFMLDLDSGQLYFNELNTIPGSLAFYLWEKSKPRLLYPELLSHLIERAKHRKSQALCNQRLIEFKAL